MISDLCEIETDLVPVSLSNFERICRICLQNDNKMVDVFSNGMDRQFMKVVNLKISREDGLPNKICQNCSLQICYFQEFRCQAKSANEYLKAMLQFGQEINNSGISDVSKENSVTSVRKKKRKKCRASKTFSRKKVKTHVTNENLYIIVVPPEKSESDTPADICIKDLNQGKENVLTQLCQSVVQKKLLDHNYPKEMSSHDVPISKEQYDNCKLGKLETPYENFDSSRKDLYLVNMFIHECCDCGVSFEHEKELLRHIDESGHNRDIINLICPVCFERTDDKSDFYAHLSNHVQVGVGLAKVDSSGQVLLVLESEKELFLSQKEASQCINKPEKIYKVLLESYVCRGCDESIESFSEYLSHVETYHPDTLEQPHPSIRSSCPVCFKIWIDDKKRFLKHLSVHKNTGVQFVKVDQFGKYLPLQEADSIFTPHKVSSETYFNDWKVRGDVDEGAFKVTEALACVECDYEASSFSDLKEHCRDMHCHTAEQTEGFTCPVCGAHFSGTNADELRNEYYEHLQQHPDNRSLRIEENGTDVDSDKVESNEKETMEDIWTPEVGFPGEEKKSECKKYTCDICHKDFKTKREVSSHLRQHRINSNSQDYVCEICGKKCFGRANYNRHYVTHTKGNIEASPLASRHQKCRICDKTFSNRSSFNEHFRQHQDSDKDYFGNQPPTIICEVCGRRFFSSSSLNKHKKQHLTNKENSLFKCEICERGFCRQPAFDRHVAAHLNPNYFECETCKFPLPSLISLQKHTEMHQISNATFDCKACNLSFLSKDGLTGHQTHTGHHQDREPLECNVCHEKFYVGKKFAQHIKTHPKYKMSECTLCGKRLSTVQSLMLHMGRHFESNSILCPHCGKQFFEEGNYHRHLLTHKGIKPFPCDFEGCEKSFYTLYEVKRHKKYHNNTRDFSCPYCSKSFHESNHLKVHVRTHTGERPYTCPHCTKGFVTRTRCKQHIKLMHQGVGYELILSNISKKVAVFDTLDT